MELLESVEVANTSDAAKDDKCPFCHKKPIGHATKKPKEVNDKVTSVPSDLGCTIDRGTIDDLPYTTAQHHLISAMQCYARIRRLVRMGNMVGYDINNPTNGIGLPTTHHTLKYPKGTKKVKYGDLDEPEGKRDVAFRLMKALGAQWHVGHHAFDVAVNKKDVDSWDEGGPDEQDTDDLPHETSYDVRMISKLFNLLKSIPKDLCEEPKKDDKFKSQMDKISKQIRTKLEKFKKGSNPAHSSPLFVSLRAYEYSGVAKTLKPQIAVGNVSR
jgi:hypothetical protein